MNFAVVIEGMTLITFMVVLLGGKQKRETGWKILSGLLVLVGALQCAGMALIVSPVFFSPSLGHTLSNECPEARTSEMRSSNCLLFVL